MKIHALRHKSRGTQDSLGDNNAGIHTAAEIHNTRDTHNCHDESSHTSTRENEREPTGEGNMAWIQVPHPQSDGGDGEIKVQKLHEEIQEYDVCDSESDHPP